MLGPRVNEEESTIEITYSIRVLEGEYTDQVEIDGCYQLDGLDAETVMDELYPALVDQFEEAFPDAELQYYEP